MQYKIVTGAKDVVQQITCLACTNTRFDHHTTKRKKEKKTITKEQNLVWKIKECFGGSDI